MEKDPKTEFLKEIIERMNDLFLEDGLSENDFILAAKIDQLINV